MSKRDQDGIYTRKDRDGFWMSYIDANGRRRQKRLQATTKAEAKRMRSSILARVQKMTVLGVAEASDENFEVLAKRFLNHQQPRLSVRSWEREKGIVEHHLMPFFAGKLASIRRERVQAYVTQRLGEASAHSVQKEFNVIKHMLRMAVEWEMIPVNPAEKLQAPKVPPGRVRYLNPAELTDLLEACPEWLRPIVMLAVATGMRRGEIVGLRWANFDTATSAQRLILPQTKNGESRVVYLNEIAQMAISMLERKQSGKLFPDVNNNQVTTAFRRAAKKAGIENFRFHDLRHTTASWLRMSGADIHTVATMLGHKDLRMASRYQHLDPTYLAKAAAQLDGVFSSILGKPKAT